MNNLNAQTAYVGSTEITQVRKGDRLVLAPNGNKLWYDSNELPSLDLRFAEDKSLVDATTGSNLVDFTRASSGTYVGSDGLIKTATTNLLTYSEEADSPAWNIISSSVTVDPDVVTAPDGKQTADKVKEAATTGGHTIEFTAFPFQAGVTYACSCFVKAAERSRIRMTFPVIFTNRLVFFDIDPNSYQVISDGGTIASIAPAGNGWFRVSAVTTADTTTAGARVSITLVDTGTNVIYTGDGTSGIYIWGAQLEQSSTVGEYVKTTSTINSAPRFDHDPTTGESLGLLVEESRTNLVLQSEDFSTTWTATNTTVSTNQTTAPDGNTTADKILETATTAEHNVRQDTASQAAGTYTISIFAKAGERSNLQFVSTGVLGVFRANFDLTNGVLGSVNTELTASIEPYPNDWYRCIVTATSSTSGTLRAQWNIITSSTAVRVESYAGDITKGLYLWGAQLE